MYFYYPHRTDGNIHETGVLMQVSFKHISNVGEQRTVHAEMFCLYTQQEWRKETEHNSQFECDSLYITKVNRIISVEDN